MKKTLVKTKMLFLIFSIIFLQFSFSQNILNIKERATVIKEIQKDRIENLLPRLMDETNLDMWVIIAREYNEDPIIKTLLPPTWLNARRRTILVFYYDKKSNQLDKVSISRYNFGDNILEQIMNFFSIMPLKKFGKK